MWCNFLLILMLRLSNNKFAPASAGDSVKVPVPEVYRSKCAPRSVIGVVMDVDKEKSLYKIGISNGVLKSLFSRGQFVVCKESFLWPDDVPAHWTSVREASLSSTSSLIHTKTYFLATYHRSPSSKQRVMKRYRKSLKNHSIGSFCVGSMNLSTGSKYRLFWALNQASGRFSPNDWGRI